MAVAGRDVAGGGGGVGKLKEGWAAQSTESSACYELTTINLIFVHFVIYILFVCFLMKIVQKREEGRRAALTTK